MLYSHILEVLLLAPIPGHFGEWKWHWSTVSAWAGVWHQGVFSTRFSTPLMCSSSPASEPRLTSDSPTTRQDPAHLHWWGNTNSHAKSHLQHCCLQKIQRKPQPAHLCLTHTGVWLQNTHPQPRPSLSWRDSPSGSLGDPHHIPWMSHQMLWSQKVLLLSH